MNIWLLVKREIRHRTLGFLTGIVSLAVATAGLVAGVNLLRAHQLATEQTLLETERELRSEMTALEDRYRRIMRDMGHNVLIVHRDQDMARLRSRGYPDTYLDDDDVWKLAHGDVTTLNHLLPVLQERMQWPEKQIDIMLSGIRGQVPVFTKPEFLTDDGQYRSPITERVAPGTADVGATVARALNLRSGDPVVLSGHSFTVNQVYAPRGTVEDITVTVPLEAAQDMLGRPGKINGIFALECVCDLDELGGLHKEVEAILPHAKVYEYSSLIVARAGVRKRAEEAHRQVVRAVTVHRESMRRDKQRLAAVVVPLLFAGASVWIFFLIFSNVRERRHEIGILRAVGGTRLMVLRVFLLKALILGLAGGFIGCLLGVWLAFAWAEAGLPLSQLPAMIDARGVVAGLLLAPVLSCTAALVPAVKAANLDPAVILREE